MFTQKELTFLHVYHHCSTVIVIFLGLVDNATYTWIAVWLNCFVHTLMYYYYFVSNFGYSPWWKKYLTVMQMIQFWINILGLATFAVLRMLSIQCAGTALSWSGSAFVNVSFYILFQMFYNRTYSTTKKSPKDE